MVDLDPIQLGQHLFLLLWGAHIRRKVSDRRGQLFAREKLLFLLFFLQFTLLLKCDLSVLTEIEHHLANDWIELFDQLGDFQFLKVHSEPECEHHFVFEMRLAFGFLKVKEGFLQVGNLFVEDVLQSWVFDGKQAQPIKYGQYRFVNGR